MHRLYRLKEMLCEELKSYGERDSLTLSSLDMVDKLAHATKNINKIIEHSEASKMGRFVSRDGSDMARKLREMMYDAPDEGTRQEIQRLADRMERM